MSAPPGILISAIAACMLAGATRGQHAPLTLAVLVASTVSALGQQGPQFLPGPRIDIGHDPAEVIAADVDGDGNTDLTAAVPGHAAVRLGDGLGGFGPRVQFPAGTAPETIDAVDLDEDGDLDLVLAANFGELVWLRNSGSGTFLPPATLLLGVDAHDVSHPQGTR